MALKTVFIDFTSQSTIPTNAYSVLLSSSDGTYGIKRKDTGQVIVPNDTAVANPYTGRYEYSIDIEYNVEYIVSWAVIPTSGDNTIYTTQSLFETAIVASQIKGYPSKKGTFIQGTDGSLILKITNINGSVLDPDQIAITIQDVNGATIINDIPIKVTDGYYVYDWKISQQQAPGICNVTWTYDIDGSSYTINEQVIVASLGEQTSSKLFTRRVIEFRMALEIMVREFQAVKVQDEPGVLAKNLQTVRFTFPRWNATAETSISRNNVQQDSGFAIDYDRGMVIFDSPLTKFDQVTAIYNFRWFTDNDLNIALSNSVAMFNLYPPAGNSDLNQIQDRYIGLILYGSTVDLIRKIMLSLSFQEAQLVFGGPDAADKLFNRLDTLKKNYEDTWNKGLDMKKMGPYVGLTRSIVVPSFSIPGGACITPYSTMTYKQNDVVKNGTVKEVYDIISSGNKVYVLSDNNGYVSFENISRIWKTKEKEIITLKTKNGRYIDASEEHLFFANNEYKPLFQLKENDELLCYSNNNIEKDYVLLVEKTGKKIEMYDLEVPTTENLFANNIKCHNSRWFRELFK